MSKSLGLRKLKLKKLPRGTFKYMVKLQVCPRDGMTLKRNQEEVKEIKHLLDDNGTGKYKFVKPPKKNLVDVLYLEEKTDLMLVKMCYAKYIYRIYEVHVEK